MRVGVLLAVLLISVLLLVFIRALWVKPELHLPESLRTMKTQLRALAQPSARPPRTVEPWLNFQAKVQKKASKKAIHPKISAALVAGWDPRSLESLAKHAENLTHVCPEMLSITGQPARLEADPDREALAAFRAARLKIVPLLTNLNGTHWDTDAVEGLLQSQPDIQARFIDQVADSLKESEAAGVLIDWQGIDPSFAGPLAEFLGRMRETLRAGNLELWLSIPVGEDLRSFDLERLPGAVDYLVAQLHDENGETDAPGPISAQPWFEGWLRTLMGYGESSQWILSLGTYGYDWNTSTGKTETISFADAMARAHESGATSVTSTSPDFSPNLSYTLEGESHEVWFLDAATFANQLRCVDQEGCAGVLLNKLGEEDPGIWPLLKTASGDAPAKALLGRLETIEPKNVIAQIGSGDFLRAELDTAPGQRQLWTDGRGYVSETYQQWPVYPTIVHLGQGKSEEVCLTFDDGPDPQWTLQVLDILKHYGVHATFFVLGKQAERYPELIRRILDEGHEIGSHTYMHSNLSEASDEQVTLELNATQRLLEWLTGRTTLLFRPPYNADSMPASLDEARPIAQATDLGYITVGESIDPQDWSRPGAEAIFQRVRRQREQGNTILLHDAGGDRQQTVEALPRILDFLMARGDSVVRAGELIGLDREQTMPKIAATTSHAAIYVTNAGLFLLHLGEELLWTFMIAASILTLIRSLVLAFLALRRRKKSTGDFLPPLSVVIAAYNEEKVVAATLRSLLKSDYPSPLEIIVVDDGSNDETSREAQAMGDSRVRVLRQANAGKARALARGTDVARHEFVVFLDADTQFQPDTLRRLIQPLADPRVGAVSGHARVGNTNHLITRFQSLEYICGFNLDRRAYDSINAITVAPGAISAFRKAAIASAGGFASDTLAEDTDLTLCLHRAGWKVTYEPEAIAWTEAPETVRSLARQRFRWAFGTMQCVWKHRDLILNPRSPGLGCFSLPSIVFFQILLVAAIPIVDLLLIISLFTGAGLPFVIYFFAFLLCDLVLSLLACWIEEEPLAQALWIIPMRFFYRPILSFVVWRSILHILRGAWVGWGKLERQGTVTQPVFNA